MLVSESRRLCQLMAQRFLSESARLQQLKDQSVTIAAASANNITVQASKVLQMFPQGICSCVPVRTRQHVTINGKEPV